MPSQQAKNWVWTLNNWTDEEQEALRAIGTELPETKYIVWGREEGENGTPHLQGYVSLTKKRGLRFIRNFISNRAHFEVMRGTPKEAADYCKKDGDYDEFGELPIGQGRRSDLEAIANQIKAGATLREIAETNPAAVIQFGTGIIRLKQHCRPERDGPPEIWVLWGKTGTGKTRRVWEFANVDELWVHPGDKWFDGYDGQAAALFDDFDGSWFKISFLLRLLDRYPMQVQVKGAYAWWVPKTIYITSNIHPNDWYPNALEEHKRALMRRLTQFGHIEECHRF